MSLLGIIKSENQNYLYLSCAEILRKALSKYIIKQWCPLRLSIPDLVLLNGMVGIYVFSFWCYLLNCNVSFMLISIIKQTHDNGQYEMKWKKLQFNPYIFQSLLEDNTKMALPVNGLAIAIGNQHAKQKVIKVCNPYCGPRAEAYSELKEIIQKNPDVKLRIIFTASGEDWDKKTLLAQHLLVIQEKYGPFLVHQALDD